MKIFEINILTLRLAAAVFNEDPLSMLMRPRPFNADEMESINARIAHLRNIMPIDLLNRAIDFLEQLNDHCSGPFKFKWTKEPDPQTGAIKWWIKHL